MQCYLAHVIPNKSGIFVVIHENGSLIHVQLFVTESEATFLVTFSCSQECIYTHSEYGCTHAIQAIHTYSKKTRKKNHLIIILLDNYIGPQTIKPFCVCSFAHILLLVCTVPPPPSSRKARQSTSAHDRFWQFSSFRNSFKHCFLILCPSGFVVEVSKLKSASQFQKFIWVSHFSAKH